MHLCFAFSWRTSWKPFVCFSIWFEHTFDFHCFIFMIFCLCSSSCYNMVAKSLLSGLCLSCPCFKFFDLSTQCSTSLIKLWWCMSPQKLFFFITYLLEDEQELSLGMLIRLKCIYNFWCSMLIFTPFALCLVTLRGVFKRFPELTSLTRCHSASSLFFAIFEFQKCYTGNILGIGRNKFQNSYFSQKRTKGRTRAEGGPEAALTMRGHGPGPGRAHLWWGPPGRLLMMPLHL
jgi:hypothetical protein